MKGAAFWCLFMELLNKLREIQPYQNLREQLQAGKTIPGLGLPRASRLPILACLHGDLNLPILLVTDRADHALALFDELGFWVKSARYLFAEPNPLFYEEAAWDKETGSPTQETYGRLGLSDVADELDKKGLLA